MSFPLRRSALFLALTAAFAVSAAAAQLNGAAQSVMPVSTIQIISINYHRLASDPVAQQMETQLLPSQVQGLDALLTRGGVQPGTDLNRLTFATFQAKKGIELIGIAEGNLGNLQLSKFFQKTPKQPNPPQINGVDVYDAGGLNFFLADPATLIFGSKQAITEAINTQQAGRNIGQNEQLSDLIAGTQTSDVWSVINTQGSRTMVHALIAGATGPIDPSTIDQHFNGARYTIGFQNQVQLNLELMTTDALSAAAVSTGMNAAIALRSRQEKNPVAKALLNQVQVDSAGNNAFLQVAAPETNIAALMKTDLFRTILQQH
jgi:hypothetical protein